MGVEVGGGGGDFFFSRLQPCFATDSVPPALIFNRAAAAVDTRVLRVVCVCVRVLGECRESARHPGVGGGGPAKRGYGVEEVLP